ncbi:MAG: hypothetical protein WAN75_50465 [Xanthobacteraceae bacterium]|jgi:hypothetical protein
MEGANTYTRTTTVNAEALIVKWLAGNGACRHRGGTLDSAAS